MRTNLENLKEYILNKSDKDNEEIYQLFCSMDKNELISQKLIDYQLIRSYYFFYNRFNGNKDIFKLGFDLERDLELRLITEEEFISNINYYLDLVDEGFIYEIMSLSKVNKNIVIMPNDLYNIYKNIEKITKEIKW